MLMGETTRNCQRSLGERIALALAVPFVVGVVAMSASAAIGGGGGYTFSDVSIEQTEGVPDSPGAVPDVTVRYSTAWAGDDFPGWRNCTIRVLAEDGSVLGVKHIELVDLTEDPSTKRTEVPIHGAQSSPEPVSASGNCNPGRNDDPEGYWVFSDVRVTRQPAALGDLRTFEMTFNDRWVGSGTPGIEECEVTAYDAVNQALFEYAFTFTDAQRASRGLSMRIVTENEVVGEPESAEVSCDRV